MIPPTARTPAPLFALGDFTTHSGALARWKIECDALSDADIECLAYMIAERVTFSDVEGVPRGGVRLAEALKRYANRAPSGLLIVDDVCTTGASMEAHRNGRDAQGFVLFARGPRPPWVRALFTLESA